jgi:hypothetical protein
MLKLIQVAEFRCGSVRFMDSSTAEVSSGAGTHHGRSRAGLSRLLQFG